MGSMYTVVFFVGAQYCLSVQPVVAVQMAVFYREKVAGMYSGMLNAFAQVNFFTHDIQFFHLSKGIVFLY